MDPQQAFVAHLPEIVVSLAATAVLILGVVPQAAAFRPSLPWVALGGLAAVPVMLSIWPDLPGAWVRFAIAGVGILVLLTYWPDIDGKSPGEFLSSILFTLAGAMLVATADDLIVLFLGLELVSLPAYLLIAVGRRHLEAQEAGAKYFFLSVLSAAVLLYGFSFLYGTTGTVRLSDSDPKAVQTAVTAFEQATAEKARLEKAGASEAELKTAAEAHADARIRLDRVADGIPSRISAMLRSAGGMARGSVPALLLGALLIVAGLCFKLAAVPMHFYAPDVYQGSQPAVAGLMAFVPKAAGALALLQIAVGTLLPFSGAGKADPALQEIWFGVFWWAAAATMTVGNVMALLQTNLKRMLAYSSIAHSGYLLVAFAGLVAAPAGLGGKTGLDNGAAAVLFYLATYGVTTLGAFALLSLVRTPGGEAAESHDDLAGLARRHPAAALGMAVFMFSLTGLPLTAGFVGKLTLFGSALSAPAEGGVPAVAPSLYWLVAIGVLNSAVSAAYYLGVVSAMYLREPAGTTRLSAARPLRFAVGLCAVLSMGWGLAPDLFGAMSRSVDAARNLSFARPFVLPESPDRPVGKRRPDRAAMKNDVDDPAPASTVAPPPPDGTGRD